MSLLEIATKVHCAEIISNGGISGADATYSVREAMRLVRRVNEVAMMTQEQRDYFEGHIPKEPRKERKSARSPRKV